MDSQNQNNVISSQEQPKKKFSTKALTFLGMMGALMFVLSFVFGGLLNTVTGNPAASGFITQIIQGVIIAVVFSTLPRFWTVTIIYVIYGVLSIPTNMWGGLPGPYKVVMSLLLGLIFDVMFRLFKYRKVGLFVAAAVSWTILTPIYLQFYKILKIPGSEKVLKYWPVMLFAFCVELCIGMAIGLKIFKRIKDKKTIQMVING